MEQIDIKEFIQIEWILGVEWRGLDGLEFDVETDPKREYGWTKSKIAWETAKQITSNEVKWIKRAKPPHHDYVVACFEIEEYPNREYQVLLAVADFEQIYSQTNLTKYIGFSGYSEAEMSNYNIRY